MQQARADPNRTGPKIRTRPAGQAGTGSTGRRDSDCIQGGTMTARSCLAALFETGAEVEDAVLKLERTGFDPDLAVSVLGRLFPAATEPGGETGREGGKPRQQHSRYCRKFRKFALFPNTSAGRIAVCGPMAGTMLEELYCGEAGALPALSRALAASGVPEHDISRYETALARGHVLLLVTSAPQEVELAVQILATGREIEVAVHHGQDPLLNLDKGHPGRLRGRRGECR